MILSTTASLVTCTTLRVDLGWTMLVGGWIVTILFIVVSYWKRGYLRLRRAGVDVEKLELLSVSRNSAESKLEQSVIDDDEILEV